MIMHNRSAMLEGTQIFFILLAVLYFIILYQKKERLKIKEYLFFGLFIGLSISVKLNSLVVILLLLFLLLKEYWSKVLTIDFKKILAERKMVFDWKSIREFISKAAACIAGILAVFCFFYYLHIASGERVAAERYYNASEEYKNILNSGQTANPFYFFQLLDEHLAFISHYEKGVPLWDPTKADENGSPALLWPFGYKGINYRWSKFSKSIQYFYFVGNPIVWYGGLIAIILGLSVIMSRFALGFKVKNQNLFNLIGIFTCLYGGYMAAVLNISRVMYLYHYLIPLVFAMILLYLIYLYVFEESLKENNKYLLWGTIILAAEVAAVFLFFSPFTYGFPLETTEFVRRMWLKIWYINYLYF